MRRSPRRPLILKRRKLPFQQNEPEPARAQSDGSKEASKPAAGQCFPDGIRIVDHPSMAGTQVVVIPKEANLQSVIGALSAKGKECGVQGPNKFILLSESQDNRSFCQASVKEESVAVGQPPNPESIGSPDVKPLSGTSMSYLPVTSAIVFDFKWMFNLVFVAFPHQPIKMRMTASPTSSGWAK